MKSFWLFRTNLRQLEYYHSFKDLETFKEECFDFYLLMTVWFLENNVFDDVVVWRLQPKVRVQDIVFSVNGKKLTQKFVDSFFECLKLPKPFVTLWRGGFQEYDEVTSKNHSFFFPRSFYLSAGNRIKPQFGGKYDRILVESDSDLQKPLWPFYKTANQRIFRPLDLRKEYDICWVCNFTQVKFKGQLFFIEQVSRSSFLKSLRICHIGNKPELGVDLCKQFGVSNIEFKGYKTRKEINQFLNKSRFALVTSNERDGSPRVITEALCSGRPLLIRKRTRLLGYYKKFGVVVFDDDEVEKKFQLAFQNYDFLENEAKNNVDSLKIDLICKKNLDYWLSQ